MSKYFTLKKDEKLKLIDLLTEVEEEKGQFDLEECEYSFEQLQERDKIKLKYARIKHIYDSLGDVEISRKMVETLCKSFSSSKCRYKDTCISKQSVCGLYKIYTLFPELSYDAILWISKEYIEDLFDKYSLIDELSMIIRTKGKTDLTFEEFMKKVDELATKEQKKYDDEACKIKMFYGHYSYDFVKHFEEFIKKHHITFKDFSDSIPSLELISKDEIKLKEVIRKSKDCFGWCDPISYQMLESYLDGDRKLEKYADKPCYYVDLLKLEIPTTFTKQDFLKSIKK